MSIWVEGHSYQSKCVQVIEGEGKKPRELLFSAPSSIPLSPLLTPMMSAGSDMQLLGWEEGSLQPPPTLEWNNKSPQNLPRTF